MLKVVTFMWAKEKAIGLLLAVLTSTRAASGAPVSGGVLVGYGFNEGYKLGLGIRGGVTLPARFYVGGALVLHEGWTGVKIEPYERPQTDLYYGGGEGGWDVSTGPFLVRPYLGVGYALVRASTLPCRVAGACVAWSNDGALGFWPGVASLFRSGGIFVGADLRYVVLVGSTYENAFSVFGTAGLEF
jgi:hypothetical protein